MDSLGYNLQLSYGYVSLSYYTLCYSNNYDIYRPVTVFRSPLPTVTDFGPTLPKVALR